MKEKEKEKIIKALVLWLRTMVQEANAKGVVFGLSGGVDSAVMAALSKLAFPANSLGLVMPCHSDPMDEEHALLLSKDIGLSTAKVDLTNTFDNLINATDLNQDNKLALANIKPRLRMTTLYYYAQSLNYLVVGPSNKSEFTVGYFTKHGDSGVDLLPLADFVKSEIWEIARYLKVPQVIIDKSPTAGLWTDQTDEEEMGFSYKDLDTYIESRVGQKHIIEKIDMMNKNSQHKRKYPPIFLKTK